MFRVMADSAIGNALKVILGRIENAVQKRPLVSNFESYALHT